jgi:hypothetical protein
MKMILIVILIAIVVLLAVIASRGRSPRPMRRTPRGLDPVVEAEIERRRVSEEADRATAATRARCLGRGDRHGPDLARVASHGRRAMTKNPAALGVTRFERNAL